MMAASPFIAQKPPQTRARLDEPSRSVAWARGWSAEFPLYLANHLPMVLVALHRMGASPQRLAEYCEIYHAEHHLAPIPERTREITPENWRQFLGQRECEGDYRAFFAGEVARLGATPAAVHYLPTVFEGFAASALHAFMRMAYATLTDCDEETATALGYWAATYLPLGVAQGRAPITDDPAQVLAYMYGPDTFKHVQTELDLLWHFMRAVAAKPEFDPVVDMLEVRADSLNRLAKVSLALFAATGDFAALHAVTGTHWLRLIAPRAPDPSVPLRYFWQAIASLVPKIGFPKAPSEAQLESWRRAPAPDWPEIFREAVNHDDEHDLSLTFSAGEEFKHYGDPLYKYAAAMRLGMI